jgi:chromosome segregation ATPase
LQESQTALQTRYNTLQESQTALQRRYNTLQESQTALQTRYNTLQESQTALQTRYNTLQESQTALQTRYNTLQESQTALQTRYNTLQESQTALQTRYNTLQESQTALQTRFNTLQTSFNTLQTTANNRDEENQRLIRQIQEIEQLLAAASTGPIPDPAEVERQRVRAEQNQATAETYQNLLGVYAAYARTPGEQQDLDAFLTSREVRGSFPNLNERVSAMITSLVNAGYQEGLSNVTDILDVVLRIQNTETRQRYLESLEARYQNEPNILTFITVLMQRLL